MSILSGLEPERVFHYFEEIAAIPHGSGNTRQISDYLVSFAGSRKLDCVQDEMGNVLIRKPGSAGKENAAPVILQGHMDMVCVKDGDCTLDLEQDGLKLKVMRREELPWLSGAPEDLIVTAEGTTLGADDGIAVAFMLTILEDDSLVHPPLECVFTVDEEIGMLGASGLDKSMLKGRMLLNLDSEEEGHLVAGCAGGSEVVITLPVDRGTRKVDIYTDRMIADIRITGLAGGHSGNDIHKGKANANVLLSRFLQGLMMDHNRQIRIVSVEGGTKDNAIPSDSRILVSCEEEDMDHIRGMVENEQDVYLSEYRNQDPGIRITVSFTPESEYEAANRTEVVPLTEISARKLVRLLYTLPAGVQSMNPDIPEMVQTSLNLGILRTEDDAVKATFLVRSNVNDKRKALVDRLERIAGEQGGTLQVVSEYAAWEFKPDSQLTGVIRECYREQYKEEILVETIHAGLECGLFMDDMPGLDAVSFGPELHDIHSTAEAMDVTSVNRTWKLLLSILERL